MDESNYVGLWVQCSSELCAVWLHGQCVGIARQADVPRRYLCPPCRVIAGGGAGGGGDSVVDRLALDRSDFAWLEHGDGDQTDKCVARRRLLEMLEYFFLGGGLLCLPIFASTSST